jgi:hypothetical protein
VAALDEPRLLHARSELGYTADIHRALHDEPEAVPEGIQERLSREARRRDLARLRDAWRLRREAIESEVDAFLALAAVPSPARHRASSIVRLARSVDRALGL